MPTELCKGGPAAGSEPYNIVARVDGEKFCVLPPSISCWAGAFLASRLRNLFRRKVFAGADKTFSLTFSGGVTSPSLSGDSCKSNAGLLKGADKALYASKAEDKNSTRLAESDQRGTGTQVWCRRRKNSSFSLFEIRSKSDE